MSNDWQSNTIALTGTIGSGKSTVAQLLQKMGAYVVSADELAREAVVPGSPGLKAVVDHFGPEFVAPDGTLERKRLGGFVFSDPKRRAELEAILHPIIRELAVKKFAVAPAHAPKIYDCPLLFEAGLHKKGFKKILLVAAPPAECIRRIIARDGVTKEEAERRLATQIPLEEKRKKADIIIENAGSLSELEAKVKKLFETL